MPPMPANRPAAVSDFLSVTNPSIPRAECVGDRRPTRALRPREENRKRIAATQKQDAAE